jgi:hypothetical protein
MLHADENHALEAPDEAASTTFHSFDPISNCTAIMSHYPSRIETNHPTSLLRSYDHAAQSPEEVELEPDAFAAPFPSHASHDFDSRTVSSSQRPRRRIRFADSIDVEDPVNRRRHSRRSGTSDPYVDANLYRDSDGRWRVSRESSARRTTVNSNGLYDADQLGSSYRSGGLSHYEGSVAPVPIPLRPHRVVEYLDDFEDSTRFGSSRYRRDDVDHHQSSSRFYGGERRTVFGKV